MNGHPVGGGKTVSYPVLECFVDPTGDRLCVTTSDLNNDSIPINFNVVVLNPATGEFLADAMVTDAKSLTGNRIVIVYGGQTMFLGYLRQQAKNSAPPATEARIYATFRPEGITHD